MKDEFNPDFMFYGVATKLLVKAANGEIDLMDLAKKQMINRGLDKAGLWVGFKQAKIIWNN